MATSLAPSLSEISAGTPIPPATLAYFQERLRNRLHQLVLREFVHQEKLGLTKKDLALRIGKKPEQITRWLGAPGNWTLDTVSDLLIGMGGEPADFQFVDLSQEQSTSAIQASDAAVGRLTLRGAQGNRGAARASAFRSARGLRPFGGSMQQQRGEPQAALRPLSSCTRAAEHGRYHPLAEEQPPQSTDSRSLVRSNSRAA